MPSEIPVFIYLFSISAGSFNLYIGGVTLEKQHRFLDGHDIVFVIQDNVGICTVPCTYELVSLELHIGLDFKLDGPVSRTPLGDIYFRIAWKVSFSMAPMVSRRSMPGFILPTSVSSTFPWKIMSPISAMVAMVVPALKVFVSMTEFPTFIGISRIIPSMVDRIRVLVVLPDFLLTPSRISSRFASAASTSCGHF